MKRSLSILSIFILILNACQQNMKTPEGDFSIHAIVEGIDTVIFEKIDNENRKIETKNTLRLILI